MQETMTQASANFTPPIAPPTANIVPPTKVSILSANVFQVSFHGILSNVSPVLLMTLIAILLNNSAATTTAWNA